MSKPKWVAGPDFLIDANKLLYVYALGSVEMPGVKVERGLRIVLRGGREFTVPYEPNLCMELLAAMVGPETEDAGDE